MGYMLQKNWNYMQIFSMPNQQFKNIAFQKKNSILRTVGLFPYKGNTFLKCILDV